MTDFKGKKVHSAHYSNPAPFEGKNVLIVGGGNSGAQILAEVSTVAKTTWATDREPTFLPDNVDGRVLFQVATEQYQAHLEGKDLDLLPSLGDIVMIDSVKDSRARGVLNSRRMFTHFTNDGVVWLDGSVESFDAVIWCTGFRPMLDHLKELGVIASNEKIKVEETRSVVEPRLWLVGYGEWTGFGSATLIGVQRYAKSTAAEVVEFIRKSEVN